MISTNKLWKTWLTLGFCCVINGQATATLGGGIKDENGKVMAGVKVVAVALADRADYRPWQGFAVSDKDGNYSIAGAPLGRVELCVDKPGGDYVNMCFWGKAAAVATLTASGSRVNADITLTPGKEVRLKLEDPEGYLERHDGKTAGAILDVGIITDQRMYLTAQPIGAQTRGAKTYRVLVPANAKWRARFGSPFFTVVNTDETSRPLNVLMELDQDVKDNEKDKEVVVRVKGIKAQEGK